MSATPGQTDDLPQVHPQVATEPERQPERSSGARFNWRCAFGLHPWSLWKQFDQHFTIYAGPPIFGAKRYDPPLHEVEVWQSRFCQRCLKMQSEQVR